MSSMVLAVLATLTGAASQPVTVPLTQQNDSHESGTATLVPDGRATEIKIVVAGDPADAVQPANIHVGTCDAVAQVRYPLHDVRNGRSVSTVNVSRNTLQHGRYVIVLQNSPMSLRAAKDFHYVACASLQVKS